MMEIVFQEPTTIDEGDALISVVIPDGITRIGAWALQGCTSLTSITIPNSVKSIGGYAFYNCTSLTSILIPDSVTSIGNYVFCNCTNLKSITINKPKGSIAGAPWGAPETTKIIWGSDYENVN